MEIPWDGMGWDRHKLLWDGTEKYVPWTSLLNHYGIRGTALNWFISYPTGRSQQVCYNGVASSNINEINLFVPQGSILGPLLFTSMTSLIA